MLRVVVMSATDLKAKPGTEVEQNLFYISRNPRPSSPTSVFLCYSPYVVMWTEAVLPLDRGITRRPATEARIGVGIP